MGQRVKDRQIDSRTARAKLSAQREPYWRLMSEGCHLGYYRGARVGKWIARFRKPGAAVGYVKKTLAEADDFRDAPQGLMEAEAAGVLSFGQAQDVARRWFDLVAHGGQPSGPYTVSDALDDYLAAFTGKALESTRNRVDVLIRPALGAVQLAKLTTKQIADWHKARASSAARIRTKKGAAEHRTRALDSDDERRRRKSTANRDLTVLKAALNHAWREGRIDSDAAWRKVKPFKEVDSAKLRYLSDDEARRLVNACDAEIRPLVQAALLTGARYGELVAIKTADVDPAVGTVWLTDTKARRPRVVYLEAEGRHLFAELVAGRSGSELVFQRAGGSRWKASQQQRPLRDAGARAKLDPPATFHDLRRTYGARLALRGVPLAVIAEAMGHADERITRKHYAHLAPSYVADTVRANVAGMGIVAPSNVHNLAGRAPGRNGQRAASASAVKGRDR